MIVLWLVPGEFIGNILSIWSARHFWGKCGFCILDQAALRAPPEEALQCIAGHCYFQLSVFFLFWPRRLCVRHTRWGCNV